MKKKLKVIILIILFPGWLNSQIIGTKIQTITNRNQNIYGGNICLSSGFSLSNYIDFATSPLTYSGIPFDFSLGFLHREENREFKTVFSLSIGYFSDQYHSGYTQSDVKIFDADISYLHRLNHFEKNKLKLLIGGDFKFTYNNRENPTLQNNSWGYEIIPTLFASSKLVWDISRTKPKQGQILFFKYNLKPRKRDLSLKLNIGIVNASYRNHYIYTDADSFTTNNYDMWDKYVFKIFSGFRASSEWVYTIYLFNGNSIKFSYLWDAYKTGGDLDRLEMAHHKLNVALVYKIY